MMEWHGLTLESMNQKYQWPSILPINCSMKLKWKEGNFYHYTQIWDIIISIWKYNRKLYFSHGWINQMIDIDSEMLDKLSLII